MLKDQPSRRSEVRTHNRQQLLKHMAIMFTIPFLCQITIWVRELVDERVRGVESDGRSTALLLAVGPQAIDGHKSQPCSKRALALPLELWDFTNHDDQNILRQVGRIVTEIREFAQANCESMADKCSWSRFQSDSAGLDCPKPFQEADGGRFQGDN